MSYILDALRKSESERQRQALPRFQSVHAGHGLRGRERRLVPAFLLALTAVLLLGGGGIWVGMRMRVDHSPASADRAPPAPAVVPGPAQAAVVTAAPVTTLATVPPPTATLIRPTPDLASAPAAVPAPVLPLVEVWELSAGEQEFLRTLTVSLHVYSDDPAQRTVIVNGLRVKESQPLGQDLVLDSITADGLVVAFRGRRVHLVTVGAS